MAVVRPLSATKRKHYTLFLHPSEIRNGLVFSALRALPGFSKPRKTTATKNPAPAPVSIGTKLPPPLTPPATAPDAAAWPFPA